jgi:hypothetical protein
MRPLHHCKSSYSILEPKVLQTNVDLRKPLYFQFQFFNLNFKIVTKQKGFLTLD